MPRSFADGGGSGGGGSSTFLGLTDTMSSFTDGSVLFTSGSAVTEDNNGLNWDDTGKKLTISSGDSTVTPSTDADELVVEGTGQTGIHIINSGSSKRIRFGDTTDSSRALISSDGDDLTIGPTNISGVLKLGAGSGASEKARVDSSGNVGIGQSSPDHRLHLKMDGTLNQSVMDVEGSTGGRLFRINTDANGHTDVGIYNASGQRKIKFGTGPTENAYFTDTYVGIGNSDPTGLLDVGSGDSTEEFFLPAPSAAPGDADLANSQWTLYLDEANDDVIIKAKESGGTVLTKTIGGGGDTFPMVDFSEDFSLASGSSFNLKYTETEQNGGTVNTNYKGGVNTEALTTTNSFSSLILDYPEVEIGNEIHVHMTTRFWMAVAADSQQGFLGFKASNTEFTNSQDMKTTNIKQVGFLFKRESGTLKLYAISANTGIETTACTDPTSNVTVHLGIKYTTTSIEFYVDGTLEATHSTEVPTSALGRDQAMYIASGTLSSAGFNRFITSNYTFKQFA